MHVTTNSPVCLSRHRESPSDAQWWMVCWCQKHNWVKRSRNVPSQCENKFKEASTEVQMSEIMKGDNQQTLLTILGTNLWLLLFKTQHFMTLGGFFAAFLKKISKSAPWREHFTNSLGYLCVYILFGTSAHTDFKSC